MNKVEKVAKALYELQVNVGWNDASAGSQRIFKERARVAIDAYEREEPTWEHGDVVSIDFGKIKDCITATYHAGGNDEGQAWLISKHDDYWDAIGEWWTTEQVNSFEPKLVYRVNGLPNE
jgi:hypothetical protein